MKHKHFNRLLSMLLVVATLFGLMAVPASAASLGDSGTVTILTQNVRMGLNGKKHRRNLLQIVIGGSGAGKTRFFCKPSASVRAE